MVAAAAAEVTFPWRRRRKEIFNSVFRTEISQPTPHLTSTPRFPDLGPARSGDHAQHPGPDAGLGHDASGENVGDVGLLSGRAAADQIRFDRAWHMVTSHIALPATASAEDSFGTLEPESQRQSQDPGGDEELNSALRLVLNPKRYLPRATQTEDVLMWHTQQVRHQFVQHVIPLLSACAGGPSMMALSSGDQAMKGDDPIYYNLNMTAVMSTVRTLEGALRMYFFGLSLILRGVRRELEQDKTQGSAGRSAYTANPESLAARFKKDVVALVSRSMSPSFIRALRVVLNHLVGIILIGMPTAAATAAAAAAAAGGGGSLHRPIPPDLGDEQAQATQRRLLELVASLDNVGLAGEHFQILFAEVMDGLMSTFISTSFAASWGTGPDMPEEGSFSRLDISDLNYWVENYFARLSIQVLSSISPSLQTQLTADLVSLSDVKKWKEVAIGRLASLRISELFDIVIHWPASREELGDLRASINTPARRLQLTNAFSASLQKRLLHPAQSTLEILRVYIAMIRTFHALDHSKALLGRVVHQLQLYLCQRDDAVRIVVTGLLASPEEVKRAKEGSSGQSMEIGPSDAAQDKLVELAIILNDPAQQRRRPPNEEKLDWNDMNWVPDPIDAGINYKRPKSQDVIGTLINALGSADTFIKEFQNIIAERLLSSKTDSEQERKVLRLLKKRFGEGSLQNCEVMMKDIQDSRKLDSAIRKGHVQLAPGIFATPTTMGPEVQKELGAESGDPRYHSRILSRLFWPNISGSNFLLPAPVAAQQKRYEEGYEHLKFSRKLTWLNHLGQATVELELGDRNLAVDCRTSEAAVIYAFQDANGDASGAGGPHVSPTRRSVKDLSEMLQMDEELVLQALGFWEAKDVLRRVQGDVYVVIEDLADKKDQLASGAEAGPGGPPAESSVTDARRPVGGPRSESGLSAQQQAQRQIYWQFIKGMLTNSASTMPLSQIAMMLKMLIADGFPWSNEELQEFLADKVGDGDLELVSGKYRLIKK